MNEWDIKAELEQLSATKTDDFIAARLRYFKAAKEHSLVLKQRSRVKWAIEGDENSAFFHGIIKGRMKRNTIKGLAMNGEWLEDPTTLKQEVFGFFKRHFSEPIPVRPTFSSSKFKKFKEDQAVALERPFLELEIKDAVWACEGSKAPGPNGFTFNF